MMKTVDPVDREILKMLSHEEEEKEVLDEHDLFCRSLAPKIRRIATKSRRKSAELLLGIQKLLLDFEEDDTIVIVEAEDE
jgi:hypothetical protein